jgi:Predicted sulfurtransferase
MKWQKALCAQLGLTGRIIVAEEGINGTLGGANDALETYKKIMLEHPLFGAIDFKESAGGAANFPRLRVVVKEEITRMNVDPKKVTVRDGGKHLTPQEAHALLSNKPDDLVILDTRNYYEARIGAFTGAITPKLDHFRDFPQYIDENLEVFKDKQVLMYCTGGVRCERATAYLQVKGVAKQIYQIEGGIHRYAEQFPDGHFRGKNYVFDSRIATKVTDDILSTCDTCEVPFDTYTNCINSFCNKQILLCPPCDSALNTTCSTNCKDLVAAGKVVTRKIPRAAESCQI